MKMLSDRAAGFSLIEVTLALGVAGFCLIAVFGLLPIGVQTNQRALSQTAATAILSSVVADLRPGANSTSASTQSQLFKITIPASGAANLTPQTLYFDSSGQYATSTTPASPTPFQPRYQLNVTFPQPLPTPAPSPVKLPTYADLKVTWPANATATNASGSSEMFAAFSRP